MKEIFVYSRHAIEGVQPPDEPHIIVSINCPGEPPARISENRATLGRVNLFFWDLEKVPEGAERIKMPGSHDETVAEFNEAKLCQPEDAKKVIDLIEAHGNEAKNILVHCTAGISRSSAVAAALHKILNGSDKTIFNNKRYRPNMRVYRMMLNEWYDRHPVEEK